MERYQKRIRNINQAQYEKLGFTKNQKGYFDPSDRTSESINEKYDDMIKKVETRRKEELKCYIDLCWNNRERMREYIQTVDPTDTRMPWFENKLKEFDQILKEEDINIASLENTANSQ